MWFSSQIIQWYVKHKRPLPWRRNVDPYCVWISEIILQQTRVDQGLPYYLEFIRTFPDIHSLAKAEESAVLKAWQGLGYYSRARNLHHTAKVVVKLHGGRFPEEYGELMRLKGIGAYTAAAIASICFAQPVAVVDGNVYRVLSRFFGISSAVDSSAGKKRFSALANRVLDGKDPGLYNQAIMEFGALCCKPSNPGCVSCLLSEKCVAKRTDKVGDYPVKAKKGVPRTRFFNYVWLNVQGSALFQKRTGRDIWQNLYEPLLIESDRLLKEQEILESKEWNRHDGFGATALRETHTMEHKLTHQTIKARFWEGCVDSKGLSGISPMEMFSEAELKRLPVPRLIEKYMDDRIVRII